MVRIASFLRRTPAGREGTPVAVGVTGEGLVGVPLGGGSSWRFDHPLQQRPEVTGGVVVGLGGGELFALQAATGALLWTRPAAGMRLIGAGDDGDVTVVTLGSVSGRRNVALVVGRDGQVLRQIETEQTLGRPAALIGLVFLPWADRHVTAYDILLGQEVARLSLRRGLSSAVLDRGALFFGGASLVRLDEQVALWPADELPRAEIPELPLLPAPRLVPRLEDTQPLTAGLPDRVRAYARPTLPGEGLGLLGGRYFLGFHQVVVARRVDGDFPVWARVLPDPQIGGDTFRGGLALCDERGRVHLLGEERGALEATLELGQPVSACVVQGAGLEREESKRAVAPLPEQLAEVLREPSSALAPLQRELLGTLGRMGDAVTTQVILDLCSDPRTPAIWLSELHALVAGRRNGVGVMLGALQRRPGAGERPAPVASLARALRGLGERAAAPLLLDHLESPEIGAADRLVLAEALEELATAAELLRLQGDFERLRREAGEQDQRAALALARGLLRIDRGVGIKAVEKAAAAPDTAAPLRGELAALAPKAPRPRR
jgi:outer membrane protein assembly factor BamB